ncbi:uncharacterized protein LOC110390266 [Numida meleagris]|uniref:uncharacterized protein LOC110390266 n=1 Tax=Numida meleagris TaxID=8996 RepID=UPI000B3E3C35|nr:uncharacterized protein LOC110390266 [Numida meleagris]
MGAPTELKTDNGPGYKSHCFEAWCRTWGIRHVFGIPHNSQGQVIVERAHQLLKGRLRALKEGLSAPLIIVGAVIEEALHAAHARVKSVHTLREDCNDDVKLWSVTARIFAWALTPDVAAAHALREIERLACSSVKQANATTEVLSELLMDVDNIRHAVLQNRAAIDFLLLAQGHGCQGVEGMYCFNLSDHSESLHQKLAWMREHTQKITVDNDPFGDWLKNLFGGFWPWITQILKVVGVVLLVFICIAFCLPCLMGCLHQCLQRMMERAFDQCMEYHRLRKCL